MTGSGGRARLPGARKTTSEAAMKNPLDSLWGTVIAGLVLTAILYWIAKMAMGG
jgi:hypothetical protein